MTNIKEVIHLYLGCEMYTEFEDGSKGIVQLNEYYLKAIRQEWITDRPVPTICKIRLRRLDSISLKDSTEMGIPFEILKEVIAGDMFYPQMFLKLIQKGFWLFGDEAFEQGLIIDKNFKP